MCTYSDERDEKQGYAPREKKAIMKKSRQNFKKVKNKQKILRSKK